MQNNNHHGKRNHLRGFHTAWFFIVFLFIQSCGGGGGSLTRDPVPGTDTPTTPTLNIAMEVADRDSGSDSNSLSAATPLTITVRVTDVDNNPVDDELITFSLSNDQLASFDPASGTALTNDSGVATIDLLVGTVEGDGLVTASTESEQIATIGFSSAGDGGVSSKQIRVEIYNRESFDQSQELVVDNNLSSTNPLFVRATVLAADNSPIEDELVTFTFSQENLAFFDPSTGTALTNVEGHTDINVIVGEIAGAGMITARLSSGESAQVGFNSAGGGTAITEQPATLEFFTSALQLASSGSDEVELIALVKNERNILMEGVDVSFSTNSGELRITQGTTVADGTARAALTSQTNPENRTITVSAVAGALTQELTVDVIGTVVKINAPTSVILNDTVDATFIVADSDGNGIPHQPLTISNTGNNIISDLNPVTDETGQITVSLTAVESGVDVITASALNAQVSQSITIQEDEFNFSRTNNNEIPLNTSEDITVTWLKDNVPFAGGNVVFTTTRGTLSVPNGVTDENGQITLSISSSSAGVAVIGAQGTDDGGNIVTTRLDVEFIATDVASIIVAASPNSIGPDGQKSTITAILRDPIGNLVKNKTVGFTADDVSGGALFPPVAVTDSNGLASTVYTSNTVTSEDAITITAVEAISSVSATTTLTVADRAQFITIGTGNAVTSPDESSYVKQFSIFVTDANSNPVNNVDLTVTGTPVKYNDLLDPNASVDDPNYQVNRPAYHKGYWRPFPNLAAFEIWVPVQTHGCPNEDIDDDAIIDVGEDINGDGELSPGNIAAITGNARTDANGQALVELRYPKTFAAWVTLKITVSTPVAGSENRSSIYYTLGASADDLTVGATPPNVNPFGAGGNFIEDPDSPNETIIDGTQLVCTNTL